MAPASPSFSAFQNFPPSVLLLPWNFKIFKIFKILLPQCSFSPGTSSSTWMATGWTSLGDEGNGDGQKIGGRVVLVDGRIDIYFRDLRTDLPLNQTMPKFDSMQVPTHFYSSPQIGLCLTWPHLNHLWLPITCLLTWSLLGSLVVNIFHLIDWLANN